ncbi:hypothetical protein SAMN05443247_01104 [Bradyrhizobium erythrophlei]|nr:hypothetical protein SAMN05443247_01104 [Bradyrhizobium erythrophlei]
MARKAKADHTPDAAVEKMAAQPPLDDDANWLPMKAAHQRWAERTQDNELAVIELTKALAHDLPCMKRSVTGERTLVEPAMWTPDRLMMLWFGTDGLRVVERVQPGQSAVLTVRGWFYVSQPHFDLLLPPPAGSAPVDHDDASDTPPPRAKPGPKPYKDWPKLLARWLIAVAADDLKRLQNVDALVIDAQNLLEWAPKDNKDLRAKIVDLLRDVRR